MPDFKLCLLIAVTLHGLLPTALPAQTIYRCANSYSQLPCPGGAALSVDDSRTDAQKAQTDAATAQATRQAEQLEKSRLATERAVAVASRAGPGVSPARPKKAAAARTTRPKGAPESELFTASARRDDKKDSAKPGN